MFSPSAVWAVVTSKVGQFVGLAVGVALAIFTVYSEGKRSAKGEQDAQKLKEQARHDKRTADIERMPASDVRDRLRNDWTQR